MYVIHAALFIGALSVYDNIIVCLVYYKFHSKTVCKNTSQKREEGMRKTGLRLGGTPGSV